jgi:hypothetical protein
MDAELTHLIAALTNGCPVIGKWRIDQVVMAKSPATGLRFIEPLAGGADSSPLVLGFVSPNVSIVVFRR